MNKKVKTGFKIVGISLGAFILAMGVVIFIMFLAGVFSPRKQELGNMYFTVNDEYNENNVYVIDNETEYNFVKVVPTPEDATEIDMELTIVESDGGEIITIPESYLIGRPIIINPVTQKVTYNGKEYNIANGGIVTLKAKSLSQPLECTCKIIVDTLVEDYDIKFTDEDGNTLYQNEDGSELTKDIRDDLNGEYYKDETGYQLIEQGNEVSEKYSKYTEKLYKDSVFYAEIDTDKLFPTHSLNLYKELTMTNIFKLFNVTSSDNSAVNIEMQNLGSNLKPRAKITIKETNDFSIGSTLVNSYKNVVKRQNILNREDIDDTEKTLLINDFLIESNTYDFKVSPLEIKGIKIQRTEIGGDEGFTENGTYRLNSSLNNISNSYGIGLTLSAPTNSGYTDADLNSRLSEIEITTGYIKDDEFVSSKEFIEVEKNIENDVVYLTLKCYKINSRYSNLIRFRINADGIDEFVDLIVNCEQQEYPTFDFSTKNSYTLMIGKDNEIIDLTKLSLVSNNSKLDDSYEIRYFIMNGTSIDTTNSIIENVDGVIGYYEYVLDNNGLYGYDEQSKEYKLIKDMPDYNGNYYSLVFRNGYVKLTEDAMLKDDQNDNYVFYIYASIIKKDFYGDLIEYQWDNGTNTGLYGYYQGRIQLIDDILADAGEYIGKRYNEGAYDYIRSGNDNYVTINVGKVFEVKDIKLVDNDDVDTEISNDNIIFDKSRFIAEKEIYLTMLASEDAFNIKIMHNKGTNYQGVDISKYADGYFTLQQISDDSKYSENDYILFKLQPISSTTDFIVVTLTFNTGDDSSQGGLLVYKLNIKVLSDRISELHLKANDNEDKIDIVGEIDNNSGTMKWVTGEGNNKTTEIKFTLTYLPKTTNAKNLDLATLKFKVYRINDDGTRVEDDSILSLTATLDDKNNVVITAVINKNGNIIVQAVYTDEYASEEREVLSNELAVNITVPDVTFKGYTNTTGETDGTVSVVDSKLLREGLILGGFINVYQTNDAIQTSLNSTFLSFEMIDNSNLSELFSVTNGRLKLSRQIDKSYIIKLKVGTTFGSLIKDSEGNDVYLEVIVSPDIQVAVNSDASKDGDVYTLDYDGTSVQFKFENNTLTLLKSSNTVDISKLLRLTNNSENVDIFTLEKDYQNNNFSIIEITTSIILKNTSSQNVLYINYIINSGTEYQSEASVTIMVDIVESF